MYKLINRFTVNPKTLFLIDSIGAFITAFVLFVLIGNFNKYFGMPTKELTYLSIIAICFCVYSTACFLFLKGRWTTFLKIIAISNLLYCTLTIGLIIKNYSVLTIIGITYFLTEIVIICGLCYLEIIVANKIKERYMTKQTIE
jgi:hypothetical protein